MSPMLSFRAVTGRLAALPVRHLHGRFATWTLRYMDDSPPGRFATRTFRIIGRFDTRTFRYLPGRFATERQRLANTNCRLFIMWPESGDILHATVLGSSVCQTFH